MSRSFRKTPIIGFTTCASEKPDKKRWHRAWRSKQRQVLRSASPEDLAEILPICENQVVSPFLMGKDGHQYWPLAHQQAVAERLAGTEQTRREARLRHKFMGK